MFTILSLFDGNLKIAGEEFTIADAYIPVYQTLLMVVYGAYFAGRSIEKVKKVTK
jgi:glutathione S-transferase